MQCCLFLSRGKSQHIKFQAFSEAMLLQPTPLGSWWKQLGIGGRSAALGSGDKPLLWDPLGDRDDSAQCRQSVPRNYPELRGKVHGADLGLPATGCRDGSTGYMGTNAKEERSLPPWCLMGLRTEGTWALLRPWAAVLEAHGWTSSGLHQAPFERYLSCPTSLLRHCSRVIQPSALWRKLPISPANVYYPFYLMHYYVLILRETEKETIR